MSMTAQRATVASPWLSLLLVACTAGCSNGESAPTKEGMDPSTRLDAGQLDAAKNPPTRTDAGAVSPGDAESPREDAQAPQVDAALPAEDAGLTEPECQVRQLGTSVISHACLHAQVGPFRDAAVSSVPAEAIEVNRPHTAFLLTSANQGVGFVGYQPSVSGPHAFFLSRPSLVSLRHSMMSVPEYVSSREVTSPCDELPNLSVFELVADEPYLLELEADELPLTLVVESLSELGAQAWERTCDCTSLALDTACSEDAQCCSGLCMEGTCARVPTPRECETGLATGESCISNEQCCSGTCGGGVCVAVMQCRTSGPCASDEECCAFCHDFDHCH